MPELIHHPPLTDQGRFMGRILQALRQKPDRPATPRVHLPEQDPEPSDEMPFIEVGGPNRLVEASPSVLASGPVPASRAVVNLTPADPVVIPPPPRVELPAAAPAVVLRPLPTEPPPPPPNT